MYNMTLDFKHGTLFQRVYVHSSRLWADTRHSPVVDTRTWTLNRKITASLSRHMTGDFE